VSLVFSLLGVQFDGSWVDIGSLCTGTFWVGLRARRRILLASLNAYSPSTAYLIGRATGGDFATGVSFFPFFMLMLAPLSSQLLAGLLDGNKVILSVAGLIALSGTIRDG
jgi:hypothetical protein